MDTLTENRKDKSSLIKENSSNTSPSETSTQKEYKEKVPENRLIEELNKLKVDTGKMREDGTFEELLSGRKTSRLISATCSAAGTDIEFKARLASHKEEDGTVKISIHPVRISLKEEMEKEFMGHTFSEEEKGNLKALGNAGKVIMLYGKDGEEKPALVSVDKLTKEIVAVEQRNVIIPDYYKNVRLSDLNKEVLTGGEPVLIKNIESGKGHLFSGLIGYNAGLQRLELLQYGLSISQIRNVKLDEKQQELLNEGKTVLIPGFIDSKGEQYNAWVRLDMKTREIAQSKILPEQAIEKEELIRPSNDYTTQVTQNSNGIHSEENKFNQQPLKSGKVKDPEEQQTKTDSLIPLLTQWIKRGTRFPEQEVKSVFSFLDGKYAIDHQKTAIQQIALSCQSYCNKEEVDKIEKKLLKTADQFNRQLSNSRKTTL